MSELQIGLLIIGAIVIGAVAAYNRLQESRFRKRAQASFVPDRGDALLEPPPPRAERIEPLLSPAASEAEPTADLRVEPPVGVVAAPVDDGEAEPSPIDYVVQVDCTQSITRDSLQQLIEGLHGLGKRVQILASTSLGEWYPVANAPADVTRVRVALQLADRRGHVTEDDLTAFQRLVEQWAESEGASMHAPPLAPFARAAKELDQFCADVDVVVGLNVVAATGDPFSGFKVRNCAETVGFRLDEGAFRFPDRDGRTLFSLENLQSGPLDPDNIKTSTINGVTLLLDVPRLDNGIKAFDRMVDTGKLLADNLGGTLVDDNGASVTEPGLEQIRNQLRQIYGTMEARGIGAGSRVALRLFS